MRAPVLLALGVSTLLACGTSAQPPQKDGEVGGSASAIINGTADTTHQAVVMLALQEGQQGGSAPARS